MEDQQTEQSAVKPKYSKLAIIAAVTGILPLLITPSVLLNESLPASHATDIMLFATLIIRLIPVVLGSWSCFHIIQSNGKTKGLVFSILAVFLGLFWTLMLFELCFGCIYGAWYS